MVERDEELAALMVREQGKPLAEASAEIAYAPRSTSGSARRRSGSTARVIPSPWPDRRIVVTREPVGVTAGITPWNFPAAMRPASPRRRSPSAARWC